jgi:hypothetical protein
VNATTQDGNGNGWLRKAVAGLVIGFVGALGGNQVALSIAMARQETIVAGLRDALAEAKGQMGDRYTGKMRREDAIRQADVDRVQDERQNTFDRRIERCEARRGP